MDDSSPSPSPEPQQKRAKFTGTSRPRLNEISGCYSHLKRHHSAGNTPGVPLAFKSACARIEAKEAQKSTLFNSSGSDDDSELDFNVSDSPRKPRVDYQGQDEDGNEVFCVTCGNEAEYDTTAIVLNGQETQVPVCSLHCEEAWLHKHDHMVMRAPIPAAVPPVPVPVLCCNVAPSAPPPSPSLTTLTQMNMGMTDAEFRDLEAALMGLKSPESPATIGNGPASLFV